MGVDEVQHVQQVHTECHTTLLVVPPWRCNRDLQFVERMSPANPAIKSSTRVNQPNSINGGSGGGPKSLLG